MKILMVNKFFFPKGGAEAVYFNSAEILKSHGHKVIFFSMKHEKNVRSEYEKYFISNIDYKKGGMKNAILSSLKLLYSLEARKKIEELISIEKPDVAHLHNIYHQISPSILHSLKKFRVPVVMTLPDYKICCGQYLMIADNKTCEACSGNAYYHCFLKRCVGNSLSRSFLSTLEMYLHHDILRIYDLVDYFISPSAFLKEKIESMGFKGRKIMVLPNVVFSEKYTPAYRTLKNSILYFGRLSLEKGLNTLLEAFKGVNDTTLRIVGEGPLRRHLESKAKEGGMRNIVFPGYKTGEELKEEIRDSLFTILPSEWYENNPLSILESFAFGKPVIGARIGGIPELISDGKTGLTFEPGNAEDLRSKIKYLLSRPDEIEAMGRHARDFIEKESDNHSYYSRLMEIYELAMGQRATETRRCNAKG